MESTLQLLENGGYIKIVEDKSTGIQEIQKVPNGNNTNT